MQKTILFPNKISFGFSWLIFTPLLVWIIPGYFLPLLGGNLDQNGIWIVTVSICLLVGASLVLHVLAHLFVAWRTEKRLPGAITILPFGDAAQSWPTAGSKKNELLITSAGPLCNLLLCGAAFLIWNSQTNDTINLSALFVCLFNAWIFLFNLIPAFPLDSGRLLKVFIRGFGRTGTQAARRGRQLGLIIAAAMAIWGVFLIFQNSRFSWETGSITFLFILLILDGVRLKPVMETAEPDPPKRSTKYPVIHAISVGLLCLVLLAASATLLPTNNGLEAPGVALPIEPMIRIPAQYRHPVAGQFFLVTVISQAPITLGEWLIGQVDPAVQIVPPETVTPKNTSPQQQARQYYQMLDSSETTAIAVGLRLAGYNSVVVGKGVVVDSFVAGSHAIGLLQPGDIIIGLNGNPIQTTSDLIAAIKAQTSSTPVHLLVKRGQAQINLAIPLMAPATPNDTPKMGVQIEPAGFDYNPPFPVSIVTNKISGGPSAGLMFTLSVYNSLISQDLTSGKKIAGTGTIDLDGSVGPIGGVKQKIFAAEAVGAKYFLCPVDNYADAVSVAKSIKVIKIATVNQAVDFLRSLPS